jgi:hypothetical protein
MPSLAHAGSDILLTTFLHGQKVCCGGVNDAAHLAKRPGQRMSASHLFKSLTPDPIREEGYRKHQAGIVHDRKKIGVRGLNARKLVDTAERYLGRFMRTELGDDRVFRPIERSGPACDLPPIRPAQTSTWTPSAAAASRPKCARPKRR